MVTPSNEVLDNKITNMVELNNKEHGEIKDILTSLSKKIDELENKYVTRLEFKAIVWFVWILSVLIGIVWFFLNK